jgi:hypothetical protein
MSFWKDALTPKWSSMGPAPQWIANGLQTMPQSLQQNLNVSPQVANLATPSLAPSNGQGGGPIMPPPVAPAQGTTQAPRAQMLAQQLRNDARGMAG